MPNNAGAWRGIAVVGAADFEAGNLLSEEMYLAGVAARETFEDFGESAFGAVLAIEEGGDNGETQAVTRLDVRAGRQITWRIHGQVRRQVSAQFNASRWASDGWRRLRTRRMPEP